MVKLLIHHSAQKKLSGKLQLCQNKIKTDETNTQRKLNIIK